MQDILIIPGQLYYIDLIDCYLDELKLHSNVDYLRIKPSMQMRNVTKNRVRIVIDCRACTDDYQIYNIVRTYIDRTITPYPPIDEDLPGDLPTTINADKSVTIDRHGVLEHVANLDTQMKAVDWDMLYSAIVSNEKQSVFAAERGSGFPVDYFQAKTLERYETFDASLLHAITDKKTILVCFPPDTMYGKLDWDQFDMTYEELTTIHVVAESWRLHYGTANPKRKDIILLPIVNQMFEVSSIDYEKGTDNKVLYFILTLRFIVDRASVAKDTDILDISDMIAGDDELVTDDPLRYDESVEPSKPTMATDINQSIPGRSNPGTAVDAEHTELVWHMQLLKTTETVTLSSYALYHTYAIIYYDSQWCKIYSNKALGVTIFALDNTVIYEGQLSGDIEVAKLYAVKEPLDSFSMNAVYTSPVPPPGVKPLHLINHVEAL